MQFQQRLPRWFMRVIQQVEEIKCKEDIKNSKEISAGSSSR